MTKKTEQHKIYAQLAELLSPRSPKLPSKVFVSSVNSLTALKAVLIAIFRQKSGVIFILNHFYGKQKRVVPGKDYYFFRLYINLA
jgi:hypothetical protein